ncbi:unnamed protein product [Lota lota]
MEDELFYTTVVFKTNKVSPCDSIVIKDEINKEPSGSHDLVTSGNRSQYPALIASVFFGLLSLLLLSAIIYMVLHSRGPYTELERQVEDLKRERDALNWTLNVITAMEIFPVNKYCSKKVCNPCQKGWVFFGSSCYFFSYVWMQWSESQEYCQNSQAQLVIIQKQEEQEFIANRTVIYYWNNDRGYWTGGKWQTGSRWTWEDGSELTTTYWVDGSPPSSGCIQSLTKTDQLASWSSTSCYQKNRFICESPALMKTV